MPHLEKFHIFVNDAGTGDKTRNIVRAMRKSIMDELLEALMPEFVQTFSARQPHGGTDSDVELPHDEQEGIPAVKPDDTPAVVTEEPASGDSAECRRTVGNLRDLIIYSEIMKPKYDS